MIPDDLGQRLHDRATRGEQLSADDRGQLQEWYAQNDREEMVRLASTPAPRDLAQLQAQVQRAAGQLVAQAHRIQELTAENAELRHAISTLEKRLADRRRTQPA